MASSASSGFMAIVGMAMIPSDLSATKGTDRAMSACWLGRLPRPPFGTVIARSQTCARASG